MSLTLQIQITVRTGLLLPPTCPNTPVPITGIGTVTKYGMKPFFTAKNAVFSKFASPLSFNINQNARTVVYGPLKWNLLEIIAGKVPDPSKRISFPGIGQELWPSQAIQLTRFGQTSSSSSQAPFVGARYESFRDEFDISLREVLQTKSKQGTPAEEIEAVATQLDLTDYLDNWYVGLSNGQSRRAQLALALLHKPRLLVMDEPFLGLDPTNREKISTILNKLPIPVVIGLRDGESTPQWATQVLYASHEGVLEGEEALKKVAASNALAQEQINKSGRSRTTTSLSEPVIEMKDVTIKYPNAATPLFDNLNLVVHRGERVHVSGPNGSGKSTLLALITADHPQSWSSDISLFGERLRVGKHSYFSINQHIGHSSPEVHAIFPKRMIARRAISTGFSGTMFPPATLTSEQEQRIEHVAQRLGIRLDDRPFGELPLDEQKLVLLARALVKDPKILILDEAFSTLNPTQMNAAFTILDEFEGAVLIVGHVEQEVPLCDKKLQL